MNSASLLPGVLRVGALAKVASTQRFAPCGARFAPVMDQVAPTAIAFAHAADPAAAQEDQS